jgi:CDP-2,3-bis-(O-geranylgeranyl)-sn-glycerol synthase
MHAVPELLWAMLPAYCANMAPPFLRFWPGWNRPISVRWLGEHKTVMGFLAGVATGALAGYALSRIGWETSVVASRDLPLVGLAQGLGAMSGDALKSFFKRRRSIAPGARWIPADQLDFALGALALAWPWLHLGALDVAAILAITFAGDIAVNQLSFRLGIRKTPW